MMRVALDASPQTLSSGGLRRYSDELLRALRNCFPADTYEPLAPRGRFWWSVQLPMQLRSYDVFHGVNFEVPYLPVRPSVMTVHDLSPWMTPDWHSGADRVRRRTPALIRLGIATLIITPTRAVRRQLLARFDVHPDRVVAIPEAASVQRVDMPPGPPFFLFVGTIEPRKNVPALIAAWRPLRDSAGLVIAGRRRSDAPDIEPELGLTLEGEVSEQRLAELYSSALALVYPSEYEGFGLPVMEAMACGTPVITSRDAAVLEVSDGAALHVSLGELTQTMRAMLDKSDLRQSLAEAGLRRASAFSWETTAALTRDAYVQAIERYRTVS